jgi:hypothetical protein
MDKSEHQVVLSKIDSTNSNPSDELENFLIHEDSKPTLTELNAILLIVMAGLAAVFVVATFLLSAS